MTCREMHEFLMAYLDGELPAEQHAIFVKHLDRCRHCVHYLESYRVTVHLCRGAFAEPPPPVPEELVRAVLVARRG
jgi:anti-sigma factor RsiW